MLGLLFFEKGDYKMTNASQKSKVWDNHIVDPEAPAGFTFRETYPENPNGVTVLLEQWDAGSFEDAHHHPHDDMSVMVEGEMDEISEEEMVEAIKAAHEAIKMQCDAQLRLAEAFGKKEIREYDPEVEDEELA